MGLPNNNFIQGVFCFPLFGCVSLELLFILFLLHFNYLCNPTSTLPFFIITNQHSLSFLKQITKYVFLHNYLYIYLGSFKKYNRAAKIFTLYKTILKTKKAHRPTMKNTKNAPSTMRIIYLIHDRLDLFVQIWIVKSKQFILSILSLKLVTQSFH